MNSVADERLDRFLDGEISSAEHQQIIAWLEADADHVCQLAERAELHADLRRSLQRRSIQKHAMSELAEQMVVRATSESTASRRELWKLATPVAISIALLAVVCLVIAYFSKNESSHTESDPGAIAVVAYQSEVRWVDRDRVVGDSIEAGTLVLDVGIVRLDFANGVAVTLQGPAIFELLNEGHTRLHSGVLTAHIPDSAIGFEIETPALEVVDLGTSFGVSVGADGETDVCVFEGVVEVNLAGDQQPKSRRQVLEGTAVRLRAGSLDIEAAEYQSALYEDSWSVTAGVLQATGLMKLVSPGPRFVPGRYEDSDFILVFPEQSGVELTEDVPVDLVEPGKYQRLHRQTQHSIPTGTRVGSYLLQLDPPGRLERHAPGKSRVIGQITFDRPILGLIGSGARLLATDGILGHPDGVYGVIPRGIEPPRHAQSDESGRDVVVLSADRRTLTLDLSAGSAIDQIRVIVQSSIAQ